MICSSFLQDDVKAILSLPIAYAGVNDSLIWHFDKSVAEATTLLYGVIFAMDSSLLPTKVKSNGKSVVGLINSGNSPITDVGIVISDIL
ncbi:hypothetical protein QYF36_005691 [Acer negundo]|nr:hypothetical protein QYF36_005691 [Acer negundo]